jgi:DNA-binding transcriptional MerR regulator
MAPMSDQGQGMNQQMGLNTLAERADVSPRTVRYYIHNGLLPGPTTRGPKAGYTQAHLDRLLMIRRLQEQYLPLAEIRRVLAELDDEAVSRGLQEGERVAVETPPSSALEYVRAVMAGVPPSAAPTIGQPLPAPTAAVPSPAMPAAMKQPPLPDGAGLESSVPRPPQYEEREQSRQRWRQARHWKPDQQHTVERSRWDRISLSADVELHIRRPLSPKDQRAVHDLIEAARQLFEEGSS